MTVRRQGRPWLARAMAAYPEPVLHKAYAWGRNHRLVTDGLLGLALFACSAGQLMNSPVTVALGLATVNVLLALAVMARRRHPAAAFGIAGAVGLVQAALGFRSDGPAVHALQPTVTDAAIVVLLYTLAAYQPRRTSLTGLALCLAGSGIAIYGWTFTYDGAAFALLAVTALAATFVATWVLGDSMAYRRAYYMSIEERLVAAERARDLEGKRAQAVEESAARLRRIERDLHDGAQVRLTALAMTIGEIKETLAQPGESRREALILATQAHQAAKDTLSELRDLARGIHPAVLDRGLDAALRSLADGSAIPASLDVAMTGRPSPAIEAIVYFSAAELLANAVKHSDASHVGIGLRPVAASMMLTVTDDGAGGARVTGGGGLAGLAERLRAVDGHLGIDSPPGGPTIITVELPGHA
jgi:signal transduction histidine kinase